MALGRQRTLPFTHTTVKSCCRASSLRQLNGEPAPWRVAEKPSQVIINSLNQLRRRNSPSVAERRPTRFCNAMTSRTKPSSMRARSSLPWGPRLPSAVSGPRRRTLASLSPAGRSRLPTWSARNGGVVLAGISSPA